MRTARHERDAHISERSAHQHAQVVALHGIGQNQALPVAVKGILGAHAAKLDASAPRQGFKQQVRLGIVAQRLEVTHTHDGLVNRLLVQDATWAKPNIQPKSLAQRLAHHLKLDLSHQAQANLLELFVPGNA